MARFCEICGKGKNKANHWKKIMSKLDPVRTYFQKPNLHSMKVDGKKMRICSDCRKKIIKNSNI